MSGLDYICMYMCRRCCWLCRLPCSRRTTSCMGFPRRLNMHVCILCDKGASNISRYTLRIFGKYFSVMYVGELDGDGDTDHAKVNHMCTAHPSSPPSGSIASVNPELHPPQHKQKHDHSKYIHTTPTNVSV